MPGRGVSLDALANELKARGFRRTPGSPRLITRLRRIREVVVSQNGIITLGDGAGEAPAPPPPSRAAVVEEPIAMGTPVTPSGETEDDDVPGPGNERLPGPAPAAEKPDAARRRSRRGGRGRRGRGGRRTATTA